MSEPLSATMIDRLLPTLIALRDEALGLEQSYETELELVEPTYRASARNLLHYLSLRQHDIRNLQQDLAALGLSSLGVSEPNVLASMNAVIGVLERLRGDEPTAVAPPPADLRTGPLLLRDHARSLLGPEPLRRAVRIMVTMPSAAATDPQLVHDLLLAGMDVMRINCAHDDPARWRSMVANLRAAEQRTGRSCRVQADLAGPKVRTGPIDPIGRLLRLRPRRDALGRVSRPATVWLTAVGSALVPPGIDFVVPVTDAGALGKTKQGDVLHCRDTRDRRRKFRIVRDDLEAGRIAEISATAYLPAGAELTHRRGGRKMGELRVGLLPELIVPLRLMPNDRLELLRAPVAGSPARVEDGKVVTPARIHCTLAEAFEQVRPGERVWFDDGKIGGLVETNDGEVMGIKITHTGPNGARLRPEKGINFPDTTLELDAMTAKDVEDLGHAVEFADMVALSFLRHPADVDLLESHLHRLGAGHMGIVLKIENRQAFENLPRILLTALRSPPVGIMVARGDLAVEVGFERLSEVQEEILWLCEAAHVPVIWATQVLEGLAKKGAPSRAEVTDAAMSSRAECAMLNKGPNIVETVSFLRGILVRRDTHQHKRRATLRRLSVSELR
jgi:pyruvate kinase